MADLPDLNIIFRVGGLNEALKAFKTIGQAITDTEKAVQQNATKGADARINATKKEADEKIKEAKRAEKEVTEAAKRASKEQEKAANEAAKVAKKAAAESEKAWKDAERRKEAIQKEHHDRVSSMLGTGKGSSFGSIGTAYNAGGMGAVAGIGAIGAVLGGFALLSGALNIATQSLTAFGGFLVNDIIRPRIAAQTSSRQLANKLGNSVQSETILNAVSSLSASYGVEMKDAMSTFSEAVDNFGNYSKARFATEMSMQANRVYGIDTKAAAGFIQNAWQKNPNASEKEMKSLIASMIAMSLKEKSTMSFGDLMGAGGKATLAASLFGGDTSEEKNKHMIASSGLLFLTKGSLGSTEETVSKQNMAWLTAANVGGQFNWKNKDGSLKDEGTILKDIFKRAGSDSTKIGKLGFDSNSAVYFSTILKKLSEDARGFDAALKDATEAGNVNVNALQEMSDKMKAEDPGTQFDIFWQSLKLKFGGFADNIISLIKEQLKTNGTSIDGFIDQQVIPALYTFVSVLMSIGMSIMDLIDKFSGKKNFENGERDSLVKAKQAIDTMREKHIMEKGTQEEKVKAAAAPEVKAIKEAYKSPVQKIIDDPNSTAVDLAGAYARRYLVPLVTLGASGEDTPDQSNKDAQIKAAEERAAAAIKASNEEKAKGQALIDKMTGKQEIGVTITFEGDVPPGTTVKGEPIGQRKGK